MDLLEILEQACIVNYCSRMYVQITIQYRYLEAYKAGELKRPWKFIVK
jgi:hypothetical protein